MFDHIAPSTLARVPVETGEGDHGAWDKKVSGVATVTIDGAIVDVGGEGEKGSRTTASRRMS